MILIFKNYHDINIFLISRTALRLRKIIMDISAITQNTVDKNNHPGHLKYLLPVLSTA